MTHENKQTRELSPAERYAKALDTLASRYMDHDTLSPTEELKRLLTLAEEQNEAWRAEGFDRADPFVTQDGELISVGELIQPEDTEDDMSLGLLEEPRRSQIYRVFYRGEQRDVTVPKEFAGTSISFRGSPGRFDTMYNIGVNSNHADLPVELTEDMEWLYDRFGKKVMRHSDLYDRELRSSEIDAVSLECVALRQRDMVRSAINQDHEEAIEIEQRAMHASDAVKKKLFESATKLAARQEEAYRESIATSMKKA